MARAYPPVTLDPVVPPRLVGNIGLCEAWCGAEQEIAGLLNGEPLCDTCFEESKQRTFTVYMRGREDALCIYLPTIEAAMAEVGTMLDQPDEFGPYFPVSVYAENQTFHLEERIATVSMPGEGVMS